MNKALQVALYYYYYYYYQAAILAAIFGFSPVNKLTIKLTIIFL